MRKTAYQETIVDIANFVSKILEEVQVDKSTSYIEKFYEDQQKLKRFYEDIRQLNENYKKDINKILSKVDIAKKHPIFGVSYQKCSYSHSPLYRYIDPQEKQLTRALSCFFMESPKFCKSFVCTLLELLHQDVSICQTENFDCRSEQSTGQYFIDNIISWDKGVICIEIKFDAQLQNDLKEYQNYIKKNFKRDNIFFIVISSRDVQFEIETKKKSKKWQNLLWQDVLRMLENKLEDAKEDVKIDPDIRRYLSSLWHKVI